MIKVTGQVINIFTTEGGVNSKGEEYSSTDKVQLMGKVPNGDGQFKHDLLDLKIDDVTAWKSLQGKNIAIDVRPYAYKGTVGFSVAKGAKPQVIA